MKSIKEMLKEVNKDNPSEIDLRVISLTNYYNDLKKKKDIKKLRRLKLLVHLYPKMITKNSFRLIQEIVENPGIQTFIIRNTENITSVERGLIQKFYGQIPYTESLKATFKVSDLYEKFGLGD